MAFVDTSGTASGTASGTKRLGYAEFARMPVDGRRHEIIDGAHHGNPAPNTYHQTLSKRLHHGLYSQIELRRLGLVFYAPVDVQLTEHDIVEPDLVVVRSDRATIVGPDKIDGHPDLVVEILSPSSSRVDRTLKRDLYQRCGVTEYWIVDPVQRTIEQLVLRDDRYVAEPSSDELRPTFAADVVIRVSEIW